MGNRCVITAAPLNKKNVGIYLHWNGGVESIEGFLAAAKELGYRDPLDDCYGWARLAGLICLFFGLTESTSVGIDRCENLDCDGDNGVWLLGPGWQIVGNTYDDMPLKSAEPEKTSAIQKGLVVSARVCHDACKALTA